MSKDTEFERMQRKAHRMAEVALKRGDIVNPGYCELCGSRNGAIKLVMHHWMGYIDESAVDVKFICDYSNRTIWEHNGTSWETIRERYGVIFRNQPGLFCDDDCRFRMVFEKKKSKWAKAFISYFENWRNWHSYHFRRLKFLEFIREQAGWDAYWEARFFLMQMSEDEIFWRDSK